MRVCATGHGWIAALALAVPAAGCGGGADASLPGSGTGGAVGTTAAGGADAGGTSGVGLGSGAGGAAGVGGPAPSAGGRPEMGGVSGANDAGADTHDGGPGATPQRSDAGCDVLPAPSPLVGFASVVENGAGGTSGGAGGDVVTVTTLADLSDALSGTTPRTVVVRGTIDGSVSIGSNKTLAGACGGTVHGHLSLKSSENVIVRNLYVVGYDCTDSPNDCSGGADAITVQDGAHHLWFDHDDVSDGSDGNLDLTHAADLVTISWTKFHYSGRRTDPAGAAGGHQFSNLIGHSDGNATEDTGHLRITFHHTWWADGVVERMPRVRFGQVHLFDDLYTATGNDYCIGVGNGARILNEENLFLGVKNPIKDYATDGSGVIVTQGSQYVGTTGSQADIGTGPAFTPPYPVTLDGIFGLEAAIRAGAGPR